MLGWVNGLQRNDASDDSDGPDLALATCKHWSAYSLEGQIKKTASNPPGTYPGRHNFDALVNKQDLVDFYFPVFEACAKGCINCECHVQLQQCGHRGRKQPWCSLMRKQ